MGLEDDLFKQIVDNVYEGVYCIDSDRKIISWNKSAEQLTGYMADEVIGKNCWDNVMMHVDKNGNKLCQENMCPALQAMAGKKILELELYLHHKDGHRVPIQTRIVPLRDVNGKIFGACELFDSNVRSIDTLQKIGEPEGQVLIDATTGLGNRQYGQMSLERKFNELRRYHWGFGVLLLDIDRFKEANDTWGQEAGDKVLSFVGKTLHNCLRASDIAVRWDGEEFLVIALSTDAQKLGIVANRILALIRQSGIVVGDKMMKVTVSAGGTVAKLEDTMVELLKRADKLLKESKENGRDRVTIG